MNEFIYVELSSRGQSRARQLSKAGYKTLQQLAYCEVSQLLKDVVYLSRTQAIRLKSSAMVRPIVTS